jgi:preprotein translocase subunit SecA
MLQVVDTLWMRHLTALDELREGIGLRAYAQRDPLVEYKTEAYRMFQELLSVIKHDVAHSIYHAEVARAPAPREMHEVREDVPRERSQPRRRSKAARKVGRNAPCPCGSGKKYKQCCLRQGLSPEEAAAKAGESVEAGAVQGGGGRRPRGRRR